MLFFYLQLCLTSLRIQDCKKIGEGAFGAVFRGTYRGELVAMKKQLIEVMIACGVCGETACICHANIVWLQGTPENLDVFLATEICVLKSLRHANLLT